MRLNNVDVYLSTRLHQTDSNGNDVIDYQVDLLTRFGAYTVEKGFSELLFYSLPVGEVLGYDATSLVNTGFYGIFYNTSGTSFATTSVTTIDKYEKEDRYVYKVNSKVNLPSSTLSANEYIGKVELWYKGLDRNSNMVDIKLITSEELPLSAFAEDDGNGNKGIKLTAGNSIILHVDYSVEVAK